MRRFIDDYFVTDTGEVYSTKYGKLKKLRYYINNKGYVMYRLCVNGKVKQYSAHHLVYYCYVSSFDTKDGLVIDHIDGNKENNTPENLRRVTNRVNCNNPNTKVYGRTPSNKLNLDVDYIKSQVRLGRSYNSLAKELGCSRGTIKNRVYGEVV